MFKVKTKIDSVGELIRQINYYRNVLRETIFVVVSENDKYKDILKDQKIRFIKYEPKKYL